MTKHSLTAYRDADFAVKLGQVADSLRARGLCPSPDDIIRVALMSRPKAYYLSFSYVVRRLNVLRKSGFFKRVPSPARPIYAMWFEINSKIDVYRCRNPYATEVEAISYLLNFCTPERFYLSENRARRIFNRYFVRTGEFFQSKAV